MDHASKTDASASAAKRPAAALIAAAMREGRLQEEDWEMIYEATRGRLLATLGREGSRSDLVLCQAVASNLLFDIRDWWVRNGAERGEAPPPPPPFPERTMTDWLLSEFTGRDDEFWGIVGEGESGGAEFAGTGMSAVCCTGYALAIQKKLPGRVRVYGFWSEDNPGAAVSEYSDGHDFAVVDGRYIVDPWAQEVEGCSSWGVLDLLNEQHGSAIRRLYGDREKWEELETHNAQIEKPNSLGGGETQNAEIENTDSPGD